ncbi:MULTISPECIES: KGK domain-containing protein [unclassified Coleofasciculus]|uniref:KGK domain-containing protein n=1 Tax=unclassified Coleofasciculus TaxID=2692782 RepID=UPI00187F3CD8|nr:MULTISPECIES: KGK domain-containing protein [unclassified Coleofasciculus]MBE9124690.1 hypothetical protein [Coleofasciculus sp. LEGE 07081]MBE9147017.1 hypothetical protein [Coleofasciculus sp. LEGE 07092]
MDNQFEPLATGEVLSVDESDQILIGHCTFRVGEFAEAIRMQLEYGLGGWSPEKNAWFSAEGIPCEVLRFSSRGWQKGKVRINLEFCPQEFEDEDNGASASTEDELVLAEPETEEELEFGEPSTVMEDEVDMDESFTTMDDYEFELGTSPVSDRLPGEQSEELAAMYDEMEEESVTFEDAEIDRDEISISLDDEFDEISQSIEQELEQEEAPTTSEDEFIDLGEISVENEDDLDFDEMPESNEDEFQFGDFASDNELEEDETDSLLDDVWQDMNQSSWQNNE